MTQNSNNELGYEWVLVKQLKGHTLQDWSHQLFWLQRELFVRRVIDTFAQLFRLELLGIGSISQYNLSSGRNEEVEHVIGECIAPYFYKGEHV